ncbi:MAG: hypothetical protein RL217_1607 [Pseudomonadota bacterium]|jgi:flagella basal body P-ring formation protein FlgA
MSIVEIFKKYPVFVVFFLLDPLSAQAAWQAEVEAKLCQDWQKISEDSSECTLSFPGLSSQIILPSCTEPWQMNLLRPLQPGRNGIEISCTTPYWKQNFAVQLHSYRRVAVLARAVENGEVLQQADVNFVRYDAGALSKNSLTQSAQVLGLQSKRALKAGTILNADMLLAPTLIKRGDSIRIRVNKPGIEIEMIGTAMEAGKLGERVLVRNDSSQKTLTATVMSAGVVQVK